MSEVVRFASDLQGSLTRVGGARPFGVSAAVIGVEPLPGGLCGDMGEEDDSPPELGLVSARGVPHPGRPVLYQTEPGGTAEQCDFCTAGRGRKVALTSLDGVRREAMERRRLLRLDKDTLTTEGVVEKREEGGDDGGEEGSGSWMEAAVTKEETQVLLVKIVRGVAEAAAMADDGDRRPSSPCYDDDGGDSRRRGGEVDIWLVRRGPGRRGGCHIAVARGVPMHGDWAKKELEEAVRCLAAAAA